MKFTLLHPSRGRPQQAYDTLVNWLEASSSMYKIEHILSLDSDDLQLEKYRELFSPKHGLLERGMITVNGNTCVVEATNKAAGFSNGEILSH